MHDAVKLITCDSQGKCLVYTVQESNTPFKGLTCNTSGLAMYSDCFTAAICSRDRKFDRNGFVRRPGVVVCGLLARLDATYRADRVSVSAISRSICRQTARPPDCCISCLTSHTGWDAIICRRTEQCNTTQVVCMQLVYEQFCTSCIFWPRIAWYRDDRVACIRTLVSAMICNLNSVKSSKLFSVTYGLEFL